MTAASIARVSRLAAAIALSCLVAAGCGGEKKAAKPGSPASLVRLVVSLPDGRMAERADLELREKIRSRLDERGIGVFSGAASGKGFIDVSFRVHDSGRARRAMEVVMAAEAPRLLYQVSGEL